MTALKNLNIQKSLEVLKEFHGMLPKTGDKALNEKKAAAEQALAHLSSLFTATREMDVSGCPPETDVGGCGGTCVTQVASEE